MFTKRDRARLKLIIRGKRFGFSLEEIRQLLDLYYKDDGQMSQLEQTFDLASTRLKDLETQRSDLDLAITDLREQLKFIEKIISAQSTTRKAG